MNEKFEEIARKRLCAAMGENLEKHDLASIAFWAAMARLSPRLTMCHFRRMR